MEREQLRPVITAHSCPPGWIWAASIPGVLCDGMATREPAHPTKEAAIAAALDAYPLGTVREPLQVPQQEQNQDDDQDESE